MEKGKWSGSWRNWRILGRHAASGNPRHIITDRDVRRLANALPGSALGAEASDVARGVFMDLIVPESGEGVLGKSRTNKLLNIFVSGQSLNDPGAPDNQQQTSKRVLPKWRKK